MRSVWNPDARVQTRRTTNRLRMDPNNEREAMKTRGRIEQTYTRAVTRWEACREIARVAGFAAAAKVLRMAETIELHEPDVSLLPKKDG